MTQLLKYKSGKMTALSVIVFTATIVAMLASCDTAQLEIPEVQLTLRLSLPEAGYTIDAASGSKKGFKFGNTLFLPYCGYLQSKVTPYYKDKDYRGLYATSDYKYIFVFWNSAYNGKAGCNMPNDYNCPWDAFCIRCIRD